jgi:hypothetical protein
MNVADRIAVLENELLSNKGFNPVNLLNESAAFLAMLTGNIADEDLSLDDSQIRLGMSLTLIEATKRINTAMCLLGQPD